MSRPQHPIIWVTGKELYQTPLTLGLPSPVRLALSLSEAETLTEGREGGCKGCPCPGLAPPGKTLLQLLPADSHTYSWGEA